MKNKLSKKLKIFLTIMMVVIYHMSSAQKQEVRKPLVLPINEAIEKCCIIPMLFKKYKNNSIILHQDNLINKLILIYIHYGILTNKNIFLNKY
jgi:hypothetical protein